MQIGISRRDSGVRRNGKFFFLIPNFYHSDANRNLPRRRRPILAAEFPPPRLAPDICRGRNEYGGVYSAPPPLFLAAESPPPRRHSRERGNPFSPTNPRIHLVFCEKKRAGIPKLISANAKWKVFAAFAGEGTIFGKVCYTFRQCFILMFYLV